MGNNRLSGVAVGLGFMVLILASALPDLADSATKSSEWAELKDGSEIYVAACAACHASGVAGAVVDNLELIQIQIAERMLAVTAACRFQHASQALFELPAIDEPGKRIVLGLMTDLLLHSTSRGDVAKDHDGAQ